MRKVVVGLGNPGSRYAGTRHNAGYAVIDLLAQSPHAGRFQSRFQAQVAELNESAGKVLLVKPETFMNLSGMSVRELVEKYEAQLATDLVVLYDELDLPFGTLRVRPRGRSAGHNGVESVIGAVGTQEFARVRMGVAPDHPVGDGARYVLSQFKKAQYPVVDQVLDAAAEAVKVILAEGVQAAMNRYNRKAAAEETNGNG